MRLAPATAGLRPAEPDRDWLDAGREGRTGYPLVDACMRSLAATGWLLGWLVVRFWSDWGTPALLVWLAYEFQDALEEKLPVVSAKRVLVAVVAGLGALLVLSGNVRGQRFLTPDKPYLSLMSPDIASVLPDPGGILYTDDMQVFFRLFYHRPTGLHPHFQ